MECPRLWPYLATNLKTQTIKEKTMKQTKLILIVLAFANLAQAQSSTVSAHKVAQLFVNPKVVECLADITKLNSNVELYAGEVTQEIIGKDEIGQIAKTSFPYSLITGGDIIAGDVELIVTEEKFETWPWGFVDFVVTGCEVKEKFMSDFI